MSEYGEPFRPGLDDMIRMMDQWPVLIRILNRRGILQPTDRNALRHATKERIEKHQTFGRQLELALEERPLDAEDKRRRPDAS